MSLNVFLLKKSNGIYRRHDVGWFFIEFKKEFVLCFLNSDTQTAGLRLQATRAQVSSIWMFHMQGVFTATFKILLVLSIAYRQKYSHGICMKRGTFRLCNSLHHHFFSSYTLQPSRLIVRSGLDVPTFATRRLHACHHARAPSGGRWNCGQEMSGNFA